MSALGRRHVTSLRLVPQTPSGWGRLLLAVIVGALFLYVTGPVLWLLPEHGWALIQHARDFMEWVASQLSG